MLITAYTSAVTFGEALQHIRNDTRAIDVAANALGRALPDKRYRDFANYLSKIELNKVPGVGLIKLRLIATGLGFKTLSSFFAQIEALQAGAHLQDDPSTLAMAVDGDKAPTIARTEVQPLVDEIERLRKENERERHFSANLAKIIARDDDRHEKQIKALNRKIADLSARLSRRRRKSRKNHRGHAP